MAKQALIVGGTTGMGKATVELLLKDGVEVIVVGRKDRNLLKVEEELSELGSVITVGLDLFNLTEVQAFASNLATQFLHIQYLVNAAGYFSPKAFLAHTEEDYDIYHRFNKAFW